MASSTTTTKATDNNNSNTNTTTDAYAPALEQFFKSIQATVINYPINNKGPQNPLSRLNPQNNPCCPTNPSQGSSSPLQPCKPYFLSDINGRLLFPPKNPRDNKCNIFPWSDYVVQKYCTKPKRPKPPNVSNLPRYYRETDNRCCDAQGGCDPEEPLCCDQIIHEPPDICSGVRPMKIDPIDEEIDNDPNLPISERLATKGLRKLQSERAPIVFVVGESSGAAGTSLEFAKTLASALHFKFIQMDREIEKRQLGNDFDIPLAARLDEVKNVANRRLTRMSQCLKDTEIALNPPGVVQMVKLALIQAHSPPQGFILHNFPQSKEELELFEDTFLPMTFTVYLAGNNKMEEDKFMRRGYTPKGELLKKLLTQDGKYKERTLYLDGGVKVGKPEIEIAKKLVLAELKRLDKERKSDPEKDKKRFLKPYEIPSRAQMSPHYSVCCDPKLFEGGCAAKTLSSAGGRSSSKSPSDKQSLDTLHVNPSEAQIVNLYKDMKSRKSISNTSGGSADKRAARMDKLSKMSPNGSPSGSQSSFQGVLGTAGSTGQSFTPTSILSNSNATKSFNSQKSSPAAPSHTPSSKNPKVEDKKSAPGGKSSGGKDVKPSKTSEKADAADKSKSSKGKVEAKGQAEDKNKSSSSEETDEYDSEEEGAEAEGEEDEGEDYEDDEEDEEDDENAEEEDD